MKFDADPIAPLEIRISFGPDLFTITIIICVVSLFKLTFSFATFACKTWSGIGFLCKHKKVYFFWVINVFLLKSAQVVYIQVLIETVLEIRIDD